MSDEEVEVLEIDDVPEALRFEVKPRPEFADREVADRVAITLNDEVHYAYRPKEITMVILGGAMSQMADGPDRAWAITKFLRDCFDANARAVIDNMDITEIQDLIGKVCEYWGQDTSKWKAPQDHKAPARARARKR